MPKLVITSSTPEQIAIVRKRIKWALRLNHAIDYIARLAKKPIDYIARLAKKPILPIVRFLIRG